MLPNCEICPLKGCKKVYPSPVISSKLTIVGEAPSKFEETVGQLFIGPPGELLRKTCSRFWIPETAIYKTNALLCRPQQTLSPEEWNKAISACRPRLLAEIKTHVTVQPMGNYAFYALYGKKKLFDWLGSVLRYERRNIIPNLHPSYCFREGQYTPVFQILFHRAWLVATQQIASWKWLPTIIRPGRGMVIALQQMLQKRLPLGIDIETLGINPLQDQLTCVGASNGQLAISMPWHQYDAGKWGVQRSIEEYPLGKECAALYRELCASNIPKVLQNGQHDVLGLQAHNITLNTFDFDTMLAHTVVGPRLKHSLGFIAGIEFPCPPWKKLFNVGSELKGAAAFVKRDPKLLREYNARDCTMTVLLHTPLLQRLAQVNNGWELFQQYMRLTKNAAMPMRKRGILVNQTAVAKHKETLGAYLVTANDSVTHIAQQLGFHEYNPRSNVQRHALYFQRLGCLPTRWSKLTRKPSLDEKALQDIITGDTPLLAKQMARADLLRRKYEKLLQFVKELPPRVHPNWNPSGARTGRWSAREPNVMQIPKGLRDIFRAEQEYYFVGADYSQLELRILALLSGDPLLLRWYAEKQDVHTLNAQHLFLTDTPSKAQRNLAKIFVYGSNYGGDDRTIWSQMVIDYPGLEFTTVVQMRENWKQAHPAIAAYQRQLLAQARKEDYVEMPLSGRRHYFYGQVQPTEVQNYPIQGTGADIINAAAEAIIEATQGSKTTLSFQVHDELCLHSPNPEYAVNMLKTHMEVEKMHEGNTMVFPIDIKIGRDWGNSEAVNNLSEVVTLLKKMPPLPQL
jgi:DNA polymerase-1